MRTSDVAEKYKEVPQNVESSAATMVATVVEAGTVEIAQREDQMLGPIMEYLESNKLPTDREKARVVVLLSAQMCMWQRLLYHLWWPQRKDIRSSTRRQLAVPQVLRQEIMRLQHDELLSGHLGFNKTYERMREKYWWPNMWTTVKEYVLSCPECQQRKSSRQKPFGLMTPITGVSRPFEKVACDIVGPLPCSNAGNKYLITFTDYLTRWPEAFAVEETSAETVARVFVEQIICRHGAPEKFLTDNGSSFCNELMQEVNKLLQITPQRSTPYHPECNGLVEKFNGTLTKMLSMYISEHPKDWDVFLPYVLFAYRTSVQPSTGESPFFLMFARDPAFPYDLMYGMAPTTDAPATIHEYRGGMIQRISDGYERAQRCLQKAQASQRNHYDARHRPPTLGVGDLVLLKAQKRQSKFSKRWIGPFRITGMIGKISAKLQSVNNPRVKRLAHVSNLIRFKTSLIKSTESLQEDKQDRGQEDTMAAEKTTESQEWTVEAILSERPHPHQSTGKQYLIKWEGWPARYNQWVDGTDVNAPELLAQFRRCQVDARVTGRS